MNEIILIVDDEFRYRELYSQILGSTGFLIHTSTSAEQALDIIKDSAPSLVVTDVRMPGANGIELLRLARQEHPSLPFIIVTAFADVRDAVNAMRLGAVDYLSKPVDLEELVTAVRDALGIYREEPQQLISRSALKGIVAESPVMRSVLWDAYRIAESNANVLLTGESGSGKEIVASFIHRNSYRKNKMMVTVNCAAIPAALLAAELFGHEKGAFTGAVSRRLGKFREANDSTLFLDEIGDMPLELQPALLRAIESKRIAPVGSDREVEVNFRLIAATNRILIENTKQGSFRQDLYYRLNVISIDIPPLRERAEDILPLARYFVTLSNNENKRLSRAAAHVLVAYSWPGNVRELANVIERAVLLSQTDVILPEHFPPSILSESSLKTSNKHKATDEDSIRIKTLEQSEIQVIRHALKQTGGNRTRAAEILGITRRGLIYKLKRFGIT